MDIFHIKDDIECTLYIFFSDLCMFASWSIAISRVLRVIIPSQVIFFAFTVFNTNARAASASAITRATAQDQKTKLQQSQPKWGSRCQQAISNTYQSGF